MRTIVKVEIQTYQTKNMAGVLYMESEGTALVRDIRNVEGEHSKAINTGIRNTGMWSWTGKRGENYTIDGNNEVST